MIQYSKPCLLLAILEPFFVVRNAVQKDWIQKELNRKANASSVERLQSDVQANSDKYENLQDYCRNLETMIVSYVTNGNNKRAASPVVPNPAYKRNNIGSRVMEQVKVVTDNISMFMCVSSLKFSQAEVTRFVCLLPHLYDPILKTLSVVGNT